MSLHAPTLVGSLGRRRLAHVGARGQVAPDDVDWWLEWWIGADDRWRVPRRETTVRQRLVDDVPVVETAMRVPGGDAVHRAYATGGDSDAVVLEIANESPAPFVVAFAVRGARQIAARETLVAVDGQPALQLARRPSRWAAGSDGQVDMTVVTGRAQEGPFPPQRSRSARLEAAFLHPVAHRTTLRAALLLGGDGDLDLAALPSAADTARGWVAQLQRGMQVDLPDEARAAAVRRARAAVLLGASARRPTGPLVAALEDWGFDDEAAAAWERTGGRGRRAAARRAAQPAEWPDPAAAADDPARFLVAARSALVHEGDDGAVTLLHDVPAEWRGQSLDVRDAPTRAGRLSFSVRWHGDRPALLWEAPPGTTLRAPSLDPAWSSREPTGETLLGGVHR